MIPPQVTRVKYFFLALLAGMLFEAGYCWSRYKSASVVIANDSAAVVKDLVVKIGHNSDQAIGAIAAGGISRIRVFPHGKAAISISFKNDLGQTITSPDEYIESSGGYAATFHIGTNGTVNGNSRLDGNCLMMSLLARSKNADR